MSRYTGPRLKIIKRLGELPGLTSKVPFTKKKNIKKKSSQYSIRLETKQKLRFHYGVTEKQLIRYIQIARSSKDSTGKILLKLLEMRLDNIIFRAGLAPTIPSARQMVNHGHVCVNNNKINIPSYQCRINDKIYTRLLPKHAGWTVNVGNKKSGEYLNPSYLDVDVEESKITILNHIKYEEVGLNLNELLIVEYYSRS